MRRQLPQASPLRLYLRRHASHAAPQRTAADHPSPRPACLPSRQITQFWESNPGHLDLSIEEAIQTTRGFLRKMAQPFSLDSGCADLSRSAKALWTLEDVLRVVGVERARGTLATGAVGGGIGAVTASAPRTVADSAEAGDGAPPSPKRARTSSASLAS